ncbi:MAG: translation initiation factor IF-6 [Candidatus Diapherotrites archaeon]|nr:translation initiation factor IF-6 [Candidatus Diapherotrites archaeon]MDZ4256551.1 translation initiation factor IF-6 [archaeon]
MTIKAINLRGSPYLGIFCSTTDEIALIPEFVEQKESKRIAETLGVETLPTRLADSPLIGVLSRGYGKKFTLANCTQEEEVDALRAMGIDTLVLRDTSAVGNLVHVNRHAGLISHLIPEKDRVAIEAFFGKVLHRSTIAKSDLAGACLVGNERGYLVHPKAEAAEMQKIEDWLKIPGMRTTANYGDPFIGNSILANKHGIMVGELTSGPELARIDEGLNPGLIMR